MQQNEKKIGFLTHSARILTHSARILKNFDTFSKNFVILAFFDKNQHT